MVRIAPKYLGDGVTATHDGYQIWLSVVRDGREETIALEPDVLNRLIKYGINTGMINTKEFT